MHPINSITEFHRLLSLPEPLHPLISVIPVSEMKPFDDNVWDRFSVDFYSISLKIDVETKVRYGQQYYDFDKGIMCFTAPRQIQSVEKADIQKFRENSGIGYMLVFHPDFLYNYPIASTIKNYGFFSYSVNEALHLSANEEKNITEIFNNIQTEYQHIDKQTQGIILSYIDLLLNYSNRFYERQFITRKAVHHDLIIRMEELLNEYFDDNLIKEEIPSIGFFANKLNLSSHYLSDMLRSITGRSAQQHIHEKLIDKAKEYLSTSNMPISDIAYLLGFEYPQSFNKLFKRKTNLAPLEFRKRFYGS